MLQIKSEIHSIYQRKGLRSLLAMLTPFGKCVSKKKGHGPYILLDVVTSDGHIVAQKQNSAVSSELLSEIWSWKMEGATDTDIICRLRQRTVPTGCSYHHWCPGN